MPSGIAHDPPELVICLERIAAGGDEMQHAPPFLLADPGIGLRGAHLLEQLRLVERRGACAGHDVLGQHVEPAGPEGLAVALALVDRFLAPPSLQGIRSGCPERGSRARADRAGGWLARSAAAGANCPWARPSGPRSRYRPNRPQDRGWRCIPARADRPAPSPLRPCAAPPSTASRGGCRSADCRRSPPTASGK